METFNAVVVIVLVLAVAIGLPAASSTRRDTVGYVSFIVLMLSAVAFGALHVLMYLYKVLSGGAP